MKEERVGGLIKWWEDNDISNKLENWIADFPDKIDKFFESTDEDSPLDYFYVCINPSYWTMNHSYNRNWNCELKRLMSKYKFEHDSSAESKLGEARIWIANHLYASFTPRSNCGGHRDRPSRVTIMRAARKWKKDLTM